MARSVLGYILGLSRESDRRYMATARNKALPTI